MTSELRPAVEVWREAHEIWNDTDQAWLSGEKVHMDDKAAAAVIEADREAVRAEQAAEIERLKSHLEDAKEIIQKQIKQAAELAKFKALAETLAGALGEIAQPDYGYTDILERGCPPEKHIDYFCSMVTWRQRTAREALREYKEARDER